MPVLAWGWLHETHTTNIGPRRQYSLVHPRSRDPEGPAHDCAFWTCSTSPMHSNTRIFLFCAGLGVGLAQWKASGESKAMRRQ